MKKLALVFVSLLLLLVGCSNDDSLEGGISQPQKSNAPSNNARWYGTKKADAPLTRGVADGLKVWAQASPITVKFLNQPSDPTIVEKIKTIAKEWEKYAGTSFNFVPSTENAVVRIGFDWNANDWLTWSYTGNDAKMVRSQSNPTAVFGGIEYLDDAELKGDVLRIFGQILGLEYEQRHLGWDESWWKKDKNGDYQAQKYWEGLFEDYYEEFDWAIIKEFVFDPMASPSANLTAEIDLESIMMWPYYTRKESTQLVANYELSEGDKAFIATLYPKKSLPTIQEAWVDAGYFEWGTKENSPNEWRQGMVALKMTELGSQQEFLPDVKDGEQLNSANRMFAYSQKLKKVPQFNTSNIENFESMFSGCIELSEIPQLDTSKGFFFSSMFSYCYSLTTTPSLDTSNGMSFDCMFQGCASLISVSRIDISGGVNFDKMFDDTKMLQNIELWGTLGASNPKKNSLNIPSANLHEESIWYIIENNFGSGDTRPPFQLHLNRTLEMIYPSHMIDMANDKGITILFDL